MLDHGFQVFLSGYPETRQTPDYEAFGLHAFKPGSIIRINGRFQTVPDPANQPLQAIGTLFSPVGTITDKFKLTSLGNRMVNKPPETIFGEADQQTTYAYLKKEGYSDQIITRFFRPFPGGVYLNSYLETSAKMLEFVFRMFSEGDTTLPENGMQAIPRQLASGLPEVSVFYCQDVSAIEGTTVKLESGGRMSGKVVVVATEVPQAANLLDIFDIDLTRNRNRLFLYCFG